METIGAVETRQRLIKWIEEGQSLLGQFPRLLEETERLQAEASGVEKECERLREENAALRKEQEEIVGAFGKLLTEMLRPMNEMMQKLRGTQKKSPFEREQGTPPQNEPISTSLVPPGLSKP